MKNKFLLLFLLLIPVFAYAMKTQEVKEITPVEAVEFLSKVAGIDLKLPNQKLISIKVDIEWEYQTRHFLLKK